MKMPTMQAPIKELGPIAVKALKQMRERADKEWNKEVDEVWAKQEGRQWFWIGPLSWPTTRDEVEEMLGKVDKPSQMKFHSTFRRIYLQTRQVSTYKDFIALHKNKPDTIVTLSVEDYNVLLTWDGDGKVEETFEVKDDNIS